MEIKNFRMENLKLKPETDSNKVLNGEMINQNNI